MSTENLTVKQNPFAHLTGSPTPPDTDISTPTEADALSEMCEEKVETIGLGRQLGLTSCVSLVVGVIIGSGIFASPATVFKNSGSVGMSLVTWLGCGTLTMMSSLCYAELGTAIKASGGERTYLSRAFDPLLGFLYSWTSVIIIKPITFSAVSFACANYILEPFYPNCQDQYAYIAKIIAATAIGMSRFNYLFANYICEHLLFLENPYKIFKFSFKSIACGPMFYIKVECFHFSLKIDKLSQYHKYLKALDKNSTTFLVKLSLYLIHSYVYPSNPGPYL